MKIKNRRILGWDKNLTYYHLTGFFIGIGFGIIFTNLLNISSIIGLVIVLLSTFISLYIWHKKGIKDLFMKK